MNQWLWIGFGAIALAVLIALGWSWLVAGARDDQMMDRVTAKLGKHLNASPPTVAEFARLPIVEDPGLSFGTIEIRDGENVVGRFVLFMDDDQEVKGYR